MQHRGFFCFSSEGYSPGTNQEKNTDKQMNLKERSVREGNHANQSMSAVKPRAAAPPIILTAFEAALLDLFAAMLAEGLELDGEEEDGEVADEAAGDVAVAGPIEEVSVTPAAAHVWSATASACARSAALQLASKH